MSKLRPGVNGIDLTAVFGDGSERNDIVKIPTKAILLIIDVINEGLDILFASCEFISFRI